MVGDDLTAITAPGRAARAVRHKCRLVADRTASSRDEREILLATGRFGMDKTGYRQLLGYVRQWPGGCGRSSGKEVKPGTEWSQPTQDLLRFQLSVRCTKVNPNEFVGLVRLNGDVILETESVNDYNLAGTKAENELRQRLIDIFRES